MSEAKAVWALMHEELAEVDVEGARRWILRHDYNELKSSRFNDEILRLLPTFDPFLLGHQETSHLVEPGHYKRVYRKAGWISAVVLLNGRIIGTWSHSSRGKRFCVEVEPFQKLSKAVRTGIEEEAASLGVFREAPCEVAFGEVAR